MSWWRRSRSVDVDRLLDLDSELWPGELSRPVRRDTAEDERNAADLDELEAEEGKGPWAAELERLAAMPTVVVAVTAPGRSLDLTLTGPLRITRQLVEVALAELERPTMLVVGDHARLE